MSADLTYWEQHGDPNDPFPNEESMGGAAFQRAVQAWDKRHESKAPPEAPPGPGRTPSVGSSGGATSGNYDLSGYTAGAIAEAEQIVQDFGGFLGWPKWFDANVFVKRLLEQGNQADTQAGYEYLWSLLNADQQKANPNAYFGLTKQQYTEKMNNLIDQFQTLTGLGEVPTDIRNKALRENWTQSELQAALLKDPTMAANAPWLSAGQTYKDVQGQFGNTYGHVPNGPDQLASWWKFRTGTQSVASGGPAQQTFMPPPSLVQRQVTADTEVR